MLYHGTRKSLVITLKRVAVVSNDFVFLCINFVISKSNGMIEGVSAKC